MLVAVSMDVYNSNVNGWVNVCVNCLSLDVPMAVLVAVPMYVSIALSMAA